MAHAARVAEVAGILYEAFEQGGYRCTLVGGSAIEVYAPGGYTSGDIDVVIAPTSTRGDAATIGDIFRELGFSPRDRHWTIGDLFVEVPSRTREEPEEVVSVGPATLRIVRKEVLLADRIVGFKHWGYTAYGQQAIVMLAAFGDDLDVAWLEDRLRREDSEDAYRALRELAAGDEHVTEERLQALLATLSRRGG